MQLLNALIEHLRRTVPALQEMPNRLSAQVDEGRIRFAPGASLSHGYAVTAELTLHAYDDSLDTVMLPLLAWLARYQPELGPEPGLRFSWIFAGETPADLRLWVPLEERVVATHDCASGEITLDHRQPAFAHETCPAEHWQLLLRDDSAGDEGYRLVAEWDGPLA
ncbi:phage tail protein [Salinicola sp. JS01]|uniref:phage tail protein n=1 Tax=Salinicola sp. JS01 TaxID=3050071 RepID=UPI00255B5FAF|nr:phage tail protein [Salinicola sp. JS01]WIX33330.1 phage tail protein [Salinicola sp. JS01]